MTLFELREFIQDDGRLRFTIKEKPHHVIIYTPQAISLRDRSRIMDIVHIGCMVTFKNLPWFMNRIKKIKIIPTHGRKQ